MTTPYYALWQSQAAGGCWTGYTAKMARRSAIVAMTRQAIANHLTILEEANLAFWKRHGREKLHLVNPVPFNGIAEHWIRKFERGHQAALSPE